MGKGIDSELIKKILQFSKDRDWEKFHNEKDLAISITLEAAELLENFQWTGEKVMGKDPENMREELADILIYGVLMAHALGADLHEIVEKKLQKDGEKYPVEKAFGNAKKYDEL